MEQELQQIEALKEKLVVYVAEKGMGLLIAILIVLAAFWLGKTIGNLILKICKARNIDITLSRFFAGFARILIIAFGVIMGLSKAGIEITPFIALLGASAFGLSLAVQGPISNYGAGIVLIITRPFVVGNTLTVQGLCGIVDSVNLGSTEMINEDDERITIPNRKVLGEIFTNSEEHKIVEGIVGIDYGADPQEAIACITKAITAVEGIAERTPSVGIDGFGDSSIDIGFRAWVPTQQYHAKRYALNMAVYQALKEAKITIPFPQRDVHLITQSEA